MDMSILFYLNKLAASNDIVSRLVGMFAENPLLRGGPIFFCIFYLWFSTNDVNSRVKIIMGCFACILAVLISVFCQSHFPIHVRPIFDKRLPIVNVLKWSRDSAENRIYSFPSDTATLYYALVTIVFLKNKKLGLLSFLWAGLTVGACRVAVGLHYPSDILAGMIVGGTLVLILSNSRGLNKRFSNNILKYDPGQLYLNIFFVCFCIEAYCLFPGLTQAFYFFVQLVKGTPAG